MVAMHSPRSAARRRRKLAEILAKCTQDLSALQSEALDLAADHARLSREELSPRALEALAGLAGHGREALGRRAAELRPRGAVEVLADESPAMDRSRSPLLGWNGPSPFLAAFRRAGRRLCLALAEAREAADTQTADIVFHLLHDLERQLWLIDAKRARLPVMAEPRGLLQAC